MIHLHYNDLNHYSGGWCFIDKETTDIRIQAWLDLIRSANESGLTRGEWCKNNDISESAFYYWLKKIRKLAAKGELNSAEFTSPDQSLHRQDFFEISISRPDSPIPVRERTGSTQNHIQSSLTCSSGVSIKCNGFSIDLEEDFSKQALMSVLEVMRNV